ncbi:uncharacterized protein LOC141594896 [Silene latifolia]|uniref:uncharacterized protein LOC141594896 n=1 Tax=Silene latifolia TaxID=37657 RepID=UPI003D77481E
MPNLRDQRFHTLLKTQRWVTVAVTTFYSNNVEDSGKPDVNEGIDQMVILVDTSRACISFLSDGHLILYKSRCDNQLNEIIERASADKREAGLLGKKYEGKYKQVAEIASKLTIEEAKFREYQERKMELQQAITNMVQGGSSDGILQVCADRIPSYFEELLEALSERCKKHGLEIKSEALIELPKGWQPGIQEEAAVWDGEWD